MNSFESNNLINERLAYWQNSSPIVVGMLSKSLTATMFWIITDKPLNLKSIETDWYITEAQAAEGNAMVAVEFNADEYPLANLDLLSKIGTYSMAALRIHEAFRSKQLTHRFVDFNSEQIQKLTADFLFGKIEEIKSLDDPKYFSGQKIGQDVKDRILIRQQQLQLLQFVCKLELAKTKLFYDFIKDLQKILCPIDEIKFDKELFHVAPFYIKFLIMSPIKEILKEGSKIAKDKSFTKEERRFLFFVLDYEKASKSNEVGGAVNSRELDPLLSPTFELLQDTLNLLK